MKLGIVGNGVVGRALSQCLSLDPLNTVVVYDKFQAQFNGYERRLEINSCDFVFLCVPTPSRIDGSCDTSAVEECVAWITSPICIKSTVVPGTVERLSDGNKQIAFWPEYIGQEPEHPWKAISSCGFAVVGGPPQVCELVVKILRCCLPAQIDIRVTNSRTAELCKYMENCFLATKVAFVNQFFEIAGLMGIDFQELRELWLSDPRIGPSHTVVTEERGFGGACLPKDLDALIAAMSPLGGASLLEAVAAYNRKTRRKLGASATCV